MRRKHIGPIERHPASSLAIEARADALQRLAEQTIDNERLTDQAYGPAESGTGRA